jgi:YggT family protein
MLTQIATLLVDVVVSFFVFTLLIRFLCQWLRVPMRHGIGEFVMAVTNFMVIPARRVIPGFFGLDWASLLLAWLTQALGLWALYALAGVSFASSPDIAAGLLIALAFIDLLRYCLYIFIFVLIVQAVLSWINPHSPLAPFFDALTRPLLRPIRRFVPPLGNVDLSPLILIVLIQVLLIPLAEIRRMAGGLF